MSTGQRALSDRLPGEAALAALQREGEKWALALVLPAWDEARFELQRDPYSGAEALLARWSGARPGQVTVRGDGSVYAEWDVLCAHPRDSRLWIEAVIAWGTPPLVKSELRVLELPDES